MGELNMVVMRMGPDNLPMVCLIQNHVAVYFSADAEGIRLAEGIKSLIGQIQPQQKKPSIEIVKP